MNRTPSPRWQRVAGPGLPHGVTLLSLPWVGTAWYRRGPGYWRGRATAVVILAGVVTVYVLLYQLIIADTARRTGHGTEFWVTVSGMAALTAFGAIADLLPRTRVMRLLGPLPYLLSPGAWLVVLVGQLLPTPPDERIARDDLRRQQSGDH